MQMLICLKEDTEKLEKSVRELEIEHKETFAELGKDESSKKNILKLLLSQQLTKQEEYEDYKQMHSRAKNVSRVFETTTRGLYNAMRDIEKAFGLDGAKPTSMNPDIMERLGLSVHFEYDFALFITITI
jgi:hypothetical protein